MPRLSGVQPVQSPKRRHAKGDHGRLPNQMRTSHRQLELWVDLFTMRSGRKKTKEEVFQKTTIL